jgi:hypothetical protein
LDLERTKEISKWFSGPVFNSDDLDYYKPVNDTDQNIHLDNRQVSQRRRWQRVHREEDAIMKKQLTKELPMPETKKSRAGQWLEALDKKEKGNSIDEGWKTRTAIGAGVADATIGPGITTGTAKYLGKNVLWPATKWAGGRVAEIPGISHTIAGGKYVAGLPGRGIEAVGGGYNAVTGAIGAGAGAVKSGLASTVPNVPTAGAFATQVALPALGAYSVGALVGILSRAAMNFKYRVNKDKLKKVMHIPRTTEPEDIADTLDWFGFYEMGAMVRSGKGDPAIALQNILRALDGDRKYINPVTLRPMRVSTKISLFNMGRKAVAISDLTSTIKEAHEHIKEFDFTFMIQERFKWQEAEDYYTATMNEELLTIALMALVASLGTIQLGQFQSTLKGIDRKVSQLMGSRAEAESLKLIAGIVDAFGFKTGKLVINKRADPLLALENVLDYLEGRTRTRNASTGYKVATPIKSLATIPFGAAGAVHELLGYIEEIQELIKRVQR